MYEYDEYNPKKKDEYEETEQESIDYSADGIVKTKKAISKPN